MNEQQNIQSETPVEYNTNLNSLNEYEKPKKNPTGGIIIAILVLIIIGLAGYIAYDNGYLDKLLNKEEIPAGKPEPENVEKDITDNKTINELKHQQEIINVIGVSVISPAPTIYKNIESKDIAEGEKLNSVILYLDSHEKKYTIEDPSKYPNVKGDGIMMNGQTFDQMDINLRDFYYDDFEEGYHVIKGEDVRNLYEKVYGVKPTETTPYNTYPWYYYEKEYDAYFMVNKGGGTCGLQASQYNYKYTEDNEYAYIYTSLAYYSCSYEIYKDPEMKEILATIKEGEEIPTDFVEKNLNKLNKYRVVFKKDNGNYIFEKIEEVKE